MKGLGKKKLQRKAKQARKKAAKNGNNRVGDPSTSSPADEWFSKLTEHVLDCGPMGDAVDGIMRNMSRRTAEARTRNFGAVESLIGNNLVWLQLVLIDEKRVVQGKLHEIGGKVLPEDPNLARVSRRLWRDAAPCLLQDTECWLSSRFMVFKEYNGVIDKALQFYTHDPIGDLEEHPSDMSLDTRCTEVFLFLAGDFAVEDGSLNDCEAVQRFLRELNTEDGLRKVQGFDVVAACAKVSPKKLAQLKLLKSLQLSA